MLALCVLLGLLAGIYAKFISVMTGTLAYPTYLALYGMEFALAPGRKSKKVFFGFNLPKTGVPRQFSHWLATMVTLLLLFPLGLSFWSSLASPAAQAEFMLSAMYGRLLPPSLLLLPLGCVLGLYAISWFSELDEKTPMEKIEGLSVPGLWKSIAGE
jgi:hypothetical protein